MKEIGLGLLVLSGVLFFRGEDQGRAALFGAAGAALVWKGTR